MIDANVKMGSAKIKVDGKLEELCADVTVLVRGCIEAIAVQDSGAAELMRMALIKAASDGMLFGIDDHKEYEKLRAVVEAATAIMGRMSELNDIVNETMENLKNENK